MDLRGAVGVLLVFLTVGSMQGDAAQVRLHGREFITHELGSVANNPAETKIQLRFQTIHPNGLLLYSKGKHDFLLLDIYHGQVR